MKKIAGNPYLKKDKNKLIIDQISLDEIMKTSETPLMIFLENRLRENLDTFKTVFNSVFKECEIFYSFKANYLPQICNIVNSKGIGAEIISLPEFKLAIDIGFLPSNIIVGGPYLQDRLIKKAIECHVKEIIIYNLKDLKRIEMIAREQDYIQDISIRVNSQKYDSRLGITFDDKNLNLLKNVIGEYDHIRLSSILSHYTSQMNNVELFKKNVQAIIENMKMFSEIGVNIENINLGGGFPEATIMVKEQLEEIAFQIKTTIDESGINYKKIYFEPGRYFVGDTAIFVSKIVKVSKNRWIFLDIGNHICPKFARCSLRFYNGSKINEAHKFKTSIAGIVPTDQDVLAKNYFFTEKLSEGDLVLVLNVGAYCLTFSNRFPYALPKIYLLRDRNNELIFDPLIDKDFSIS